MNELLVQKNDISAFRGERDLLLFFEQVPWDLPAALEFRTVATVVETVSKQAGSVASGNYAQRTRFNRGVGQRKPGCIMFVSSASSVTTP